MKPIWISLLSAVTLAACGGNSSDDLDGQADALAAERADALRAPVAVQSYGANPVSVWNEIAFVTVGTTPAANADLATVHLAMYDAIIAIAGTHQPYAIRPTTSAAGLGAVAMQAAAIEAAYRVLKGVAPAGGASYETAHTNGLTALAEGDDKTRGTAIGAEVAAGMLALRANDGRNVMLPPYVPGTGPGQFRGVNPVLRMLPSIRPFATQSHAQFRARGPLALGSVAYVTDFNETKTMAAANSTQRTAAQTEVARFHTEPPGGFWARNLRQFATASPNLADNARLSAMIWTAYHDGVAGCFESKYQYNFWRPFSAITLADTDGNDATAADATWAPVVPTPNHPEYPAAHGCASGAVMEAVRSFYGTKKLHFTFNSTIATTVPHAYESTDDVLKEVMNARVWGGMHFRTSNEHGADLGKQVGHWVGNKHFQTVK